MEENRVMIGRRGEPSQISVSLFRGYADPHPIGEVDLADFLLSSTYKRQIEEIRATPSKAGRRVLKSQLPAVTPSGTFSKRCNFGLIQHSGMLCIDIDGQDNPGFTDWEAVKSTITDLPGLWYAGLSAGGNGVFLLIRIAEPDQHTEHFAALVHELLYRGLVIDAGCSDIARLRGASYDPRPYYNPYGGVFTDTVTPQRKAHDTHPAPSESDITSYRVRKLVDMIERSGANVADSYGDWYAIGRALAAEFGESGRGWYHTISSKSSKYRPKECDRQYDRCLRTCSRTGIGTFFGICKNSELTTK